MNGELISFRVGSQEADQALWSGACKIHGLPMLALPRELVPLAGGQTSIIFELSPKPPYPLRQSPLGERVSRLFPVLARCARLDHWWAILLPALWVFSYWALRLNREGSSSGGLTPSQLGIGAAAIVSALLLQSAVFALNDVSDHLRLIDLPGRARGSGVLQEGRVSARELRRAAFGMIGAAVFFGLPALWHDPLPCFAVGVLVLILSLGFSSGPLPTKYGVTGDLVLFLLYGPLFTAGFSRIVLGQLDSAVILGGFFFGILSWLMAHLKSLQDLDFDQQAQLRSLATEFGFRRGRHFFLGLLGLAYFGLTLGTFALSLPPLGLAFVALMIPAWAQVLRKLYRASGPVSALFGEIEQGTRKCVVGSAAAYLLGSVLQLLYGHV